MTYGSSRPLTVPLRFIGGDSCTLREFAFQRSDKSRSYVFSASGLSRDRRPAMHKSERKAGRLTHPNPLYLLKRNANCFAATEAIMWPPNQSHVPACRSRRGNNLYEHHHGHDERAEART